MYVLNLDILIFRIYDKRRIDEVRSAHDSLPVVGVDVGSCSLLFRITHGFSENSVHKLCVAASFVSAKKKFNFQNIG